ncbi:hypothetical protein AKJ66_03725 [candidate division MSBL1 archaeon SCGC-AAA259E22]|uniref:Big-1 domain-containing protein n=1 Tax=candidate division MSBL1 archaeon SCGC-AAA259E22 TaxID=1698265 RepID=A0A133UER5_9EURY|nr:hypothetical protein AKJ66_03725 [candidate division MSBL1 archaeon SCGC-AAA259E22]
MNKKSLIVIVVFSLTLATLALPNAEAQLRDPTSLSLSPSSFTVKSGESITLTATLTSNGTPLDGKTLEFGTTNGSVSPTLGTTDSNGEVTITYTAPAISASESTTVTATFAGNTDYKSSSASASGTIKVENLRSPTSLNLSPTSFKAKSGESITLTATLTSEGEPVEDKPIEFIADKGNVNPKAERTNSEGKVSITYTSPEVDSKTLTTVRAQFAGTPKYRSSSGRATGTITEKTKPPEAERLERTPENVYSYQPSIIFAKVKKGRRVNLSVKVDINLSSTPIPISDLGLSEPSPINYEIPMVPIPNARGWYVTGIPPLPTKTFEFTTLEENVKVLVSSEVKYELYANGEKVGEEGYRVRKGSVKQELPPLVYTAVSDVVKNPSLIEKTYGCARRPGRATGLGRATLTLRRWQCP